MISQDFAPKLSLLKLYGLFVNSCLIEGLKNKKSDIHRFTRSRNRPVLRSIIVLVDEKRDHDD